MKKLTKKDNFKMIMEVLTKAGREDLVAVMQHEVDLLDKKSNSGKMTKTQTENEKIKAKIVARLTEMAKAVTITELINADTEIAQMTNGSNQKVSALMTQLKNAGVVDRVLDKKVAKFKVAETVATEEVADVEEVAE